MKKLVEETVEGLEKLIGESVTLYCCRYIYTGKLIGVNEADVLLADGGIVYDTGCFTKKDWEDYQAFPGQWYVRTQSIESYGLLK